ncbi:exonuclease [Escherichia coli]|uniref:3'-5' exonuclease n=1 Tax=Escherichia coli TaxID=562 RepID=UPI0010CBB66D|nr:3'-5' exonuclease [Escherichia coli]GDG16796.1 exonuclease [Escherichia coli]
MELSTRNQLFSAILGGVVSGARAKEGASLRDVIRQCWRITDQSLYFSDRLETEQQIAKRWIDKGFVILDTETTGLGFDDEIVEISIIDCAGYVLLNTLVKPSKSIPEAATAIHGITDEMVANAPSWLEILPKVLELTSKGWVAYNAKFDARMLRQSGGDYEQHEDICTPECVMQLHADYNGEWDVVRRKTRWKRLVDAAAALKVDAGEGAPHRALYDCNLTLGVILAIAEGGAK